MELDMLAVGRGRSVCERDGVALNEVDYCAEVVFLPIYHVLRSVNELVL